MDWLLILGVAITAVGLALLIWCISRVMIGRKTAQSEDDLKQIIQQVLPWNLAAMGISGTGLMCVIIGIIL